MPRYYSVSFTDVGVTADQDLFQIEAVTVPCTLIACYISQNSDPADSDAENLTIRIRRVTDTLTAAVTEVKLDQRDAAGLADVIVNDETPLTTGAETIHVEAWHIAQTWIWLPPPELRIIVPVDDTVTVNLIANPADSLTMSGVLYYSEEG